MEMLLLGLAILLVIKLPLLISGIYLYRIIHDVPEPEFKGDGGDLVKAGFVPGPRRRGPEGPLMQTAASPRRGDPGHDQAPKPLRTEVNEQASTEAPNRA